MSADPFDLGRFVAAQEGTYGRALAEIRTGRKRSHWMWFVFPQVAGLGMSAMAQRYAIRSLDEARAFLAHPLLGPRLSEIAAAVLEIEAHSAAEIFGGIDAMKLRSCATLFAMASPTGSVFERVLATYFDGEPDAKTRAILEADAAG